MLLILYEVVEISVCSWNVADYMADLDPLDNDTVVYGRLRRLSPLLLPLPEGFPLPDMC